MMETRFHKAIIALTLGKEMLPKSVTKQATGILKQTLHRIFHPFIQVFSVLIKK